MPKTSEQRGKRSPEKPLPQEESRPNAQQIAHPEVPPADAEEGKEPPQEQEDTQDRLAQMGQPWAQGPQKIHGRPQDHAAEEAAQSPAEDQGRDQRRRPRFFRGSS